MAEGGDVTPIKDGSDADFDIVCTPCGEGNISEEAVKYCPDCQEYLCTTCTIHHGRQKATRSHKLLDRDTAKQGSVPAVTTKCRYHPDRDIEMYCEGHDMVYCLKCIATDHRACSGVTGIEEIKTSSIQQMEVDRLQNDTRNIQERLADTDKKKQKNIDCLEEQRDEIFTKIEDVERGLIEHIRKLKREAVSTLNKDYTLVKEKLKSGITLIANMKKEIENASSQSQTFTSMDVGQQFVQMKLIQQTVNDAVKLVEDSEAKGSKVLCFTENADLKTSIMTATSLGHVNTVTENDRQTAQRVYKVKSKKEINIKVPNDRATCQIVDLCQLQDGTIILADCNNWKIKRLDMNYNIKDHYDLGHLLRGICCTGQNEVAVKMYSNKFSLYQSAVHSLS
ncbi:E3 ubiquitin-protein ligase TRIM33-like [Mercenaria mercenaria]|uniref:E3 ubiquitin-protein ligase TRIM33-like n=1 Tax=Mercenaria mercenaria TaxID=6596 RepID=UPI00234F05E1|nr:E3 ubiquitin-protein ligase TRIM33-like [Mercenaria mercenaria]